MQQRVDHPAVAEHRDGVLVVACGAMSSTPSLTRARNAASSTLLGRWPLASRASSSGFSAAICSIGM